MLEGLTLFRARANRTRCRFPLREGAARARAPLRRGGLMMPKSELDRFLRDRRVAVLAIPRGDAGAAHDRRSGTTTTARAFRIQVEATSAKAKLLAPSGSAGARSSFRARCRRTATRSSTARAIASSRGDAERPRRRWRAATSAARRRQYVARKTRGRLAADLVLIEITPERVLTHDFRPERVLRRRTSTCTAGCARFLDDRLLTAVRLQLWRGTSAAGSRWGRLRGRRAGSEHARQVPSPSRIPHVSPIHLST